MRCIIVYSSKAFFYHRKKTILLAFGLNYNQLAFLLSQKLCSKLNEREQEVYSGTMFTLLFSNSYKLLIKSILTIKIMD
jgi:hypothetical protein